MEAIQPNFEWTEGWKYGVEFIRKHWDVTTGKMKQKLPERFHHRGDSWSCGFGEGLISGRSIVLKEKYPHAISISWPNGRIKVEYNMPEQLMSITKERDDKNTKREEEKAGKAQAR